MSTSHVRELCALAAAALLLGACTKEESSAPEQDRTLSKLKQEVDRVNKGGAPTGPPTAASDVPNARLAGLAAGADDARESRLPLPESNPTVHVDTVALKLTGLEAMHTVKSAGGMGLTSEELFLRVQLVAQNVGAAPATLDLDTARVLDAEGAAYPVARDAQVLVGTKLLSRGWDVGERADLVLLFEVPPAATRGALTLVLPASGGDVRLPLR